MSSTVRLPLALGLRPRRPTAIVDAAFELVRFRFGTVALLSLVVQLPLVVLPNLLLTADTVAQRDELVEDVYGGAFLGGLALDAISPWVWVAAAGQVMAAALLGVGVTHLLLSWVTDHDPTLGETLGRVARRAPVAVLAWLIGAPVRALGGLLCGVGAVFSIAFLFVVSPVVAAEPVGPLAAVGRSFRLTARRYGPVLGITSMVLVVSLVIESVVSIVFTAISTGEPTPLELWASSAATLLVGLAMTTLHAAWAALTYLDLRVRAEGLDLVIEAPKRLAPVDQPVEPLR